MTLKTYSTSLIKRFQSLEKSTYKLTHKDKAGSINNYDMIELASFLLFHKHEINRKNQTDTSG